MKLFHVTTRDFIDGEIIAATAPTPYYPSVTAELEKCKPPTAPSRIFCVFASDSPDYYVADLMVKKIPLHQIKLYEVEIDNPWKSPVKLVHAIDFNVRYKKPFDKLVAEYWEPTTEWNYYELFGRQMTIVRKLDVQNPDVDLIRAKHNADLLKAQQL